MWTCKHHKIHRRQISCLRLSWYAHIRVRSRRLYSTQTADVMYFRNARLMTLNTHSVRLRQTTKWIQWSYLTRWSYCVANFSLGDDRTGTEPCGRYTSWTEVDTAGDRPYIMRLTFGGRRRRTWKPVFATLWHRFALHLTPGLTCWKLNRQRSFVINYALARICN